MKFGPNKETKIYVNGELMDYLTVDFSLEQDRRDWKDQRSIWSKLNDDRSLEERREGLREELEELEELEEKFKNASEYFIRVEENEGSMDLISLVYQGHTMIKILRGRGGGCVGFDEFANPEGCEWTKGIRLLRREGHRYFRESELEIIITTIENSLWEV